MSNRPLNEYKSKGLKIVDWGNEKFALEKSFKRKDSTEWEKQKVTLFKSELVELRKLIDQALEAPQENLIDRPLRAIPLSEVLAADFDDSDVPF